MSALTGRRVLVTGASSGIGLATARACAAAGARVALVARRAERLEVLADEIGAVACPADVTDEAAAVQAVDFAAHALGGLDAVVNNAGVMRPSLIGEGRVADWRAMLEVNVLALLLVAHAALPHLRSAGRGDLVTVSSQAGRRVPNAAAGVYSGSKFAAHAVSEGLRRELHAEGIRVTVIAPGIVETDLLEGDDHDAARRLRERASELGLSPEAVAGQIVHALAQPPEVLLREIAMSATAQDT
ncbi:SDR family oxidoreductase [Egibacter rhizosphaerae]|uniref:SDR family oxidoreductase n=1 Tax=Egibacter rhizosphaerae TaxID=1670831 RepID=UPI00197AC2F0|nr:SDR family oxidoreductase [Egibacter rhizosphaerae]